MIALSVAIPGSVGLGGYGGSAVVRKVASKEQGTGNKNPHVFAVDFDSCAPLGFRDGLVTGDPESNYYGARSVTVPAVVAGLDLILASTELSRGGDVSQPAIRLAEDGIEFDSEHERHLDRCAPNFDRALLDSLFSGGALPRSGDRWEQPDLARLLRRLCDQGPAAFYQGEIAKQIVRYLRDRGGILDEADFDSCRPQIVDVASSRLSRT